MDHPIEQTVIIITTLIRERFYYISKITYSYNVDNYTYINDRLAFARAKNEGFAQMRNIAENYLKGARTDVYYNPVNSQESVLNHQLKPGVIAERTVVTLLFAVIATLFLIGKKTNVF